MNIQNLKIFILISRHPVLITCESSSSGASFDSVNTLDEYFHVRVALCFSLVEECPGWVQVVGSVDLFVFILINGLILTDLARVRLGFWSLTKLLLKMLIEIIWNHLLHVEWLLFLLLLFSFINLDWIIQDWLDSEAVHPGDGWFDSLLIFSSYEVTVEWLFHEEPEQRLSKNLLSKFHQLKQGWCFRNSFQYYSDYLGIVLHQRFDTTKREDSVGSENFRSLLASVGSSTIIYSRWLLNWVKSTTHSWSLKERSNLSLQATEAVWKPLDDVAATLWCSFGRICDILLSTDGDESILISKYHLLK